MSLMTNQVFRLAGDALGLKAGLVRIVMDVPEADIVYCAQFYPALPTESKRGGRPRLEHIKREKRIVKPPLVGQLLRVPRQELQELHDCPRRSRTEPPRRLNREPGVEADAVMVGCG